MVRKPLVLPAKRSLPSVEPATPNSAMPLTCKADEFCNEGIGLPIATPLPVTRTISVPKLLKEIVPDASVERPVLTSPFRCGFAAANEVPRLTAGDEVPVVTQVGQASVFVAGV